MGEVVVGEFEGPQRLLNDSGSGGHAQDISRTTSPGTIILMRGVPNATTLRDLGERHNLNPEHILAQR